MPLCESPLLILKAFFHSVFTQALEITSTDHKRRLDVDAADCGVDSPLCCIRNEAPKAAESEKQPLA